MLRFDGHGDQSDARRPSFRRQPRRLEGRRSPARAPGRHTTASQDRSDGRSVVTKSGGPRENSGRRTMALQTDGGALLTSRGLSYIVASMKMKCTIKAPPLSLVVLRLRSMKP